MYAHKSGCMMLGVWMSELEEPMCAYMSAATPSPPAALSGRIDAYSETDCHSNQRSCGVRHGHKTYPRSSAACLVWRRRCYAGSGPFWLTSHPAENCLLLLFQFFFKICLLMMRGASRC
jgi:hypothetical protein